MEALSATVTSNNYQAGVQAGEYIVEKLGGKGKVVIANGPPVTAVIDRVNGAKEVFAKNPGIEILSENQNAGGSRDGGLQRNAGSSDRFSRDRCRIRHQRSHRNRM